MNKTKPYKLVGKKTHSIKLDPRKRNWALNMCNWASFRLGKETFFCKMKNDWGNYVAEISLNAGFSWVSVKCSKVQIRWQAKGGFFQDYMTFGKLYLNIGVALQNQMAIWKVYSTEEFLFTYMYSLFRATSTFGWKSNKWCKTDLNYGRKTETDLYFS